MYWICSEAPFVFMTPGNPQYSLAASTTLISQRTICLLFLQAWGTMVLADETVNCRVQTSGADKAFKKKVTSAEAIRRPSSERARGYKHICQAVKWKIGFNRVFCQRMKVQAVWLGNEVLRYTQQRVLAGEKQREHNAPNKWHWDMNRGVYALKCTLYASTTHAGWKTWLWRMRVISEWRLAGENYTQKNLMTIVLKVFALCGWTILIRWDFKHV